MDAGQSGPRVEPAGQGAGARARRRHAPVRLARHRRIPRYRQPGVAAHPRAQPAAHRGQAVGSARRWRVRRGEHDRVGAQAAGAAAEQGVDRAAGAEDDRRRRRTGRASSPTRRGATAKAYTLADIAAGCALGYLDLRHGEIDWRTDYSNLARLAEKLDKRPSFQDTAPPPQ